MAFELRDYQAVAVNQLKSGSILCGGVGSGKSVTALAYYFVKECNGDIQMNGIGNYRPMRKPKDLYIITTARKRDTSEWEKDCLPFLLSTNQELNSPKTKLIIDSWNNIGKYCNVCGAFFIFDEQRVVGSGAWVKAFLQIAKKNHWILLSATPGDTWMDYIPVFIANGFYKNRTQFIRSHVIFNRYTKYPKVDRYINTDRLETLRESILVDMKYVRPTVSHELSEYAQFDISEYRLILTSRWNVYENKPIKNISELCYLLRKTTNSHPSRIKIVKDLMETHSKAIVFYNFDYELDILRKAGEELGIAVGEWNGHKHQDIPKEGRWMYLVQYSAGAEGWNCIETNVIIFYSQNYSYKITTQAAGRIDRLNTPYTDLYYYHIRSNSPIDKAIELALKSKKKFNEETFVSENAFA